MMMVYMSSAGVRTYKRLLLMLVELAFRSRVWLSASISMFLLTMTE